MAVVSEQWPRDQYGMERGPGPSFEMFVYVEHADAAVAELAARGTVVIRPPEDMPWGERVGFVADPDGNPVAVASTE